MGIILRAENWDTSSEEYTELSAASTAGATSLTVDSTDGFAVNDWIVVGKEGKEKTEVVQITAITVTSTLTIGAALAYAHSIDDAVRKLPYNQIRFYSSSTETGTFSLISGSATTIDYENATGETVYNHLDGTTSTWYKFTYYNSSDSEETAVADSTALQGGYALYCTLKDVYDLLNLKEEIPPTSQVLLMIEGRTKLFDNETNSTFISRDIGSTTDYQYLDGQGVDANVYFLGKAPIISITAIDTTTSTPGSTASWTTLTSGRDNDYILTKDLGMIEIVDSSVAPEDEPQSIRWYGVWGYSFTPDDVRLAVAKGVAMDLANSTHYRSLIRGAEGFDSTQLMLWQKDWDNIVQKYLRDQILIV